MQTNELSKELSTNFIEYAAAVNTDRALPDAKTGLKPVARRILWGAFKSGYTSNKEHVKCARIVGDVMGQWHPHGDSSIYGALVHMSRDWIMRYPLIDFHGNIGNIGGDGPAAYRYTNARLAKISEEGMLAGIKKNVVDFIPNYDENDEEPVTLPSIFPNLLCNPNTGIGVAMACNWLPHNLREVANAIESYINGEEVILPGPDFPTGGIVINKNDIPEIMRTGHGSIKVRGKYKIENNRIIFYEVPYGTSTEDLINQVGKMSESQEIEGIIDIHDESNKKGLRIVIECDKNVNIESVIKKIFLKTDFQTSISYNQVALVDKVPTELSLIDCIKIYVEHNINCLIREKTFDLNKAIARKEIVDGLLKALEDIENIITLIKNSKSSEDAKNNLINKYQFSENQAKAIIEMKLGKIAGLEKIELQKENSELENSIKQNKAFIQSPELQKEELLIRLKNLVKKYGDERRTELTQIDVKSTEKEIEAVIPEDVVIITSKAGDIKKIPLNSFKVQRRNGKGIKSEDDAILDTISTNTIDTLMVFTNKGKMYRLLVDNVPNGTNTSRGVKINTLINIEADEKVIAITSLHRKTDAKFVLFVTKNGLIKKTSIEEYLKIKRNTGIAAITLKEGDTIANVTFVKDEELLLVTKNGMSIRFKTDDIAPIGRTTVGVKGIKLDDNDEVLIGLPIHKLTDSIAVFTENGFGKKIKLEEFPIQGRAGKGVLIYKPTDTTGKIAGASMISDEDNVLVIGKPNCICISAKDIPELNRISMGNIMIKNSRIISVVKL